MARPSVAVERREQIIDAALRTIAEHGVFGASLDRIADAAGMSRGHVRHFVGNRDRLMIETAMTVFADDQGVPTVLPREISTLSDTLDYLFGPVFTASDTENAVILGLVELSRTTPAIAEILTTAYSGTTDRIADMVGAAYPGTPADVRAVIAEGIITSALGNVFLGDFSTDPERTKRTRAAADALVSALSRPE